MAYLSRILTTLPSSVISSGKEQCILWIQTETKKVNGCLKRKKIRNKGNFQKIQAQMAVNPRYFYSFLFFIPGDFGLIYLAGKTISLLHSKKLSLEKYLSNNVSLILLKGLFWEHLSCLVKPNGMWGSD